MPRALFEKTGNAVFISHLDLMRLFQRAFKRAGLPLTHTQGYSPRPSVSIALPLSVGVSSQCELLDFDLTEYGVSYPEMVEKLNAVLVDGVRILEIYPEVSKIKHLAYLDCELTLEYDRGVPADAEGEITKLFAASSLTVEKSGKNGTSEVDIIPMMRNVTISRVDDNMLCLRARICCQNPSLNPNLIVAAIERYLPELAADFVTCRRLEVYDCNDTVFR
ncbi:MAG: DUF2344 domain-containing protein [Ruminococcaceae bacterium]|nr:DUF2344 domain-containing protein [Oscillospiraceae bacterium]